MSWGAVNVLELTGSGEPALDFSATCPSCGMELIVRLPKGTEYYAGRTVRILHARRHSQGCPGCAIPIRELALGSVKWLCQNCGVEIADEGARCTECWRRICPACTTDKMCPDCWEENEWVQEHGDEL